MIETSALLMTVIHDVWLTSSCQNLYYRHIYTTDIDIMNTNTSIEGKQQTLDDKK